MYTVEMIDELRLRRRRRKKAAIDMAAGSGGALAPRAGGGTGRPSGGSGGGGRSSGLGPAGLSSLGLSAGRISALSTFRPTFGSGSSSPGPAGRTSSSSTTMPRSSRTSNVSRMGTADSGSSSGPGPAGRTSSSSTTMPRSSRTSNVSRLGTADSGSGSRNNGRGRLSSSSSSTASISTGSWASSEPTGDGSSGPSNVAMYGAGGAPGRLRRAAGYVGPSTAIRRGSDPRIAGLRGELQDCLAEKSALEKANAGLLAQYQQIQRELDRVNMRYNIWHIGARKTAEENHKHIMELESALEKCFSAEKAMQKESFAESKSELHDLRSERDILTNQKTELERTNQTLQQNVNQVSAQKEATVKALEAQTLRLSTMHTKNNETIKELENKIAALTRSLQDCQAELEIEKLRHAGAELQSERLYTDKFLELSKDRDAERNETASIREKWNAAVIELEKVRAQLQACQRANQGGNGSGNEMIRQLQETLKQQEAECQNRLQKAQNLDSNLNAQLKKLEETHDKLDLQFRNLQERNRQQQQELETMKRNSTDRTMKKECAEQIHALKENHSKQLDDLMAKYEKMRNEKEKCEENLAQLHESSVLMSPAIVPGPKTEIPAPQQWAHPVRKSRPPSAKAKIESPDKQPRPKSAISGYSRNLVFNDAKMSNDFMNQIAAQVEKVDAIDDSTQMPITPSSFPSAFYSIEERGREMFKTMHRNDAPKYYKSNIPYFQKNILNKFGSQITKRNMAISYLAHNFGVPSENILKWFKEKGLLKAKTTRKRKCTGKQKHKQPAKKRRRTGKKKICGIR
jgi:hypothetical protein